MAKGAVTCECGNAKDKAAEACTRCAYLDGTSPAQQELITVMRNTPGGMTLEALASATQRNERGIRRILDNMIKSKRARRFTEGNETATRWVYTLNG